VMTAYLVLRDHPLRLGQEGPTITLTEDDVADTDRRRGQEESVVSVAAGEQLTERQALQAVLLPSANNIAEVLARWAAGSVHRFVARMNGTARSLGMTHTRYTDTCGYDDATVSTAADQVRIVVQAMRLPVFASIVATPSATLPVAGTVHNTNTLLGHNGFVVRMNATARSLGMTHTRYTDPSGYDDATVSTAVDQVRIVDRAMRLPVFASIVATPSATLPVAGTVHTTNTLLGHNGFVGVKTGSTAAAGGCFAFRAIRWIDGRRTTITGVVLGQPGHDRIAAALVAAAAMVDRITGHRAAPDLLQRALPAPMAPPGQRSRLRVQVRRP
jgi:D-alanyl-D-alanine carboxypeptidase